MWCGARSGRNTISTVPPVDSCRNRWLALLATISAGGTTLGAGAGTGAGLAATRSAASGNSNNDFIILPGMTWARCAQRLLTSALTAVQVLLNVARDCWRHKLVDLAPEPS